MSTDPFGALGQYLTASEAAALAVQFDSGQHITRIGELDRDELAEIVYDAWLSRAGKRAAAAWLAEHRLA